LGSSSSLHGQEDCDDPTWAEAKLWPSSSSAATSLAPTATSVLRLPEVVDDGPSALPLSVELESGGLGHSHGCSSLGDTATGPAIEQHCDLAERFVPHEFWQRSREEKRDVAEEQRVEQEVSGLAEHDVAALRPEEREQSAVPGTASGFVEEPVVRDHYWGCHEHLQPHSNWARPALQWCLPSGLFGPGRWARPAKGDRSCQATAVVRVQNTFIDIEEVNESPPKMRRSRSLSPSNMRDAQYNTYVATLNTSD